VSLCIGEGAGTPVAPGVPENNTIGTYNYQIVQEGNHSYEIECYAEFANGACTPIAGQPSQAVTSLEACIAGCSAYNEGHSAILCQAVTFYQDSYTCQLCGLINSSTTFNAVARSARPVFSAYPIITDAFYLLPTTTSASLGLCTSSAYACDVISPHYSGGYNNYYENECGIYFRGLAGSAISAGNLTLLANSLGSGKITLGISTTDDYMKLCDYGTYMNSVRPG
jgi:hypothetical protein